MTFRMNEDVYRRIEDRLSQKKQVIIGVSGIRLSGKTGLLGEMTNYFSKSGVSVKSISFSERPGIVEEALNRKNPSKYYYENAFECNRLKELMGECDEQVLIVEGLLLFKNTVDIPFDFRIWVDCTFTTSASRASDEERELVSNLYMWLMRQHFSIDEPKNKADFIFINDSILAKEPESFVDSEDTMSLERLKWLNEPSKWLIRDGVIEVETDSPTDFWQRTHYGFRNDNAHLLYIETDRDFEMSCHMTFKAVHQFDQCGLAVRVDEDNWLKTSIEYELGNPPKLGAVVTNLGYSDWSTEELGFNAEEIEFRITREGADYKIEYRFDERWHQLRICHLHSPEKVVKCGIYCCSPIEAGYSISCDRIHIVERPF